MDVSSLYQSKLTTPDQAMVAIPSGSKLSMGMAMAEPPALLKALADRAGAGGIEDLKVYYCEATRIAGETILRYELNDCIHPYCMFISATLGTSRASLSQGVPLLIVSCVALVGMYGVVFVSSRVIFSVSTGTSALAALTASAPAVPFMGPAILGHFFRADQRHSDRDR
jgi:hypothetical protein